MVQPHAPAATSAEPATRIEFGSRRQRSAGSSATEDSFAAILDRSTAARVDALRQLRQRDEPMADEPTPQTSVVDPAARVRRLDAPETKVAQAKPQRSTDRGAGEPGEGDTAPARASLSTAGTGSELAPAAACTHHASPAPLGDTTTIQAPVETQATTVVAVVTPLVPAPPAPIQAPTQVAPPGIGDPIQPGFVTPPPTPAGPGPIRALPSAPALPMGPEAPAQPFAQPGLILPPPAVVPSAPQMPTSNAAQTPQPVDLPTTTQAAPTTPLPSPAQPDAAAKAQKAPSGASPQPIESAPVTAAPTPTVPLAAPAPPADPPAARGESAPFAALAAAALVESVQPLRASASRPDVPITTEEAGFVDTGIELPAIATAQRVPLVDEAGAAERGAPARTPAGTSNAVAAQLALHEDALAAPPALAAAPGLPPTPIELGTFGDHHGADAKLVAARDDVVPVRHAIVVPPETGAARIENINETVAARAVRMPMHPAVAQVAVSVTKAVQEGVDRITIKLQPPELGRIDVRLEVGVDGRIQAVFAAERPATVEILQRDVRELERALQSAGLSTDAGSLSFGLKQNGGQNGNAFAPFARTPGTGPATAEEDETSLAATRSKRAAADGRLDIHV